MFSMGWRLSYFVSNVFLSYVGTETALVKRNLQGGHETFTNEPRIKVVIVFMVLRWRGA